MMSHQEIFEGIQKLAHKDQADAEILILEKEDFEISSQQQSVDKYDFSKTQSLGIRVIQNGKEGAAYTESLQWEDIEKTYHEALSNAHCTTKDYKPELVSPQTYPQIDGLYEDGLASFPTTEKIQMALNLEKDALDMDPRIQVVPYSIVNEFTVSQTLMNTKGLNANYKKNGCVIYSFPLAQEDDRKGSGFDFQFSRNYETLNPQRVSRSAAQKAIKRIHHITPKSGNYPVILTQRAATTLLGWLADHFSAKSVSMGTSFLKGKLKTTVASPLINIVDDPLIPGGTASRPFDDEGSPSQKTTLIENGTLISYLTNSVYAKKMDLPNTANASRSPATDLDIAPSNLKIELGAHTFQDLVKSQSQILCVEELKGHAGLNPVNGDFSMEAHGVMFEDGIEKDILSNFVCSGNVLDVLQNILMVGNDSYTSLHHLTSPSLLVKSLAIAGE